VQGGVLDLSNGTVSFNQTVASLEGNAGTITNTDLTNRRTLTVNQAVPTVFSGAIGGNLALTKDGTGVLTIDGALDFPELNVEEGTLNLNNVLAVATITNDGGALNINGEATSSVVNANAGTTNIHVNQTLEELNIGAAGLVVISAAPPAPAAAELNGPGIDVPEMDAPALTAGTGAVQAVPEPGSVSLLACGLLGLLGRRRKVLRG